MVSILPVFESQNPLHDGAGKVMGVSGIAGWKALGILPRNSGVETARLLFPLFDHRQHDILVGIREFSEKKLRGGLQSITRKNIEFSS